MKGNKRRIKEYVSEYYPLKITFYTLQQRFIKVELDKSGKYYTITSDTNNELVGTKIPWEEMGYFTSDYNLLVYKVKEY